MTLAEYLKARKISQADFARKLGVSPGMVWQWIHLHRPYAGEQCIPIEVATEGLVPRHVLRPDLYPPNEPAPAPLQQTA